jgi:hypothetical protein
MDSLFLGAVTMYLFDTISSMPGIQGAKILGQVYTLRFISNTASERLVGQIQNVLNRCLALASFFYTYFKRQKYVNIKKCTLHYCMAFKAKLSRNRIPEFL